MNSTFKCSTPHALNIPFIRASFPGLFDAEISGNESSGKVPAVNISENEKSWNIEVSAPGFKKEDFKIKLENDVLAVGAEHKTEEKIEDKNFIRREFKKSSFSRSFRLKKENVDENGIVAAYENGILNINIPKKEVEQKESLKEIKVS
jgi:HSP20 family protein